MDKYHPQLGEMVRVELYGVVTDRINDDRADRVRLKVYHSERPEDFFYYWVPTVCVEPFNPNREMERNVAT